MAGKHVPYTRSAARKTTYQTSSMRFRNAEMAVPLSSPEDKSTGLRSALILSSMT